jgi:hypothetical protein
MKTGFSTCSVGADFCLKAVRQLRELSSQSGRELLFTFVQPLVNNR